MKLRDQPVAKAACPKCGSTFFQEAEYRQYQVHASAVPGGGLQPSDEVCRVKTCMCRETLPVHTIMRYIDDVEKSFQESLNWRSKCRDSRHPDKILADLADDFITRCEFQVLIEQLNRMQTLKEQGGKDAEPNAPG